MLHVLTVVALVAPLAIDTFVLGTALGAAGLPRRDRTRVSLLLTAFEAGMPVAGFLVGSGLGSAIGHLADYVAAAVLAAVGAWLLLRPEDEDEEDQVRLLQSARGWAAVVLGLSVSLDELAIGFGAGLLRLPLLVLVLLIAFQAFAAAQAGTWLGARLAEAAREAAERVAGALLVAAAALVVVERLLGA